MAILASGAAAAADPTPTIPDPFRQALRNGSSNGSGLPEVPKSVLVERLNAGQGSGGLPARTSAAKGGRESSEPVSPAAGSRDEASEQPPPSAFERYVRATKPVELSAGVEQFGYGLFLGPKNLFAPVSAVAAGPDYVLGPGDQVIVRIWGKAELEAAAEVDRDGGLALPKAGVIPVAGQTLKQVREDIRARYDKVFADYQISVSLGALKSIGITVVGQVQRPGRYSLSAMSTAVSALVAAGGPTKSGSLRDVRIVRGGKDAGALDLYELLTTGRCSGDLRLQPEDTVFVPPVGQRVALLGSVRLPAIYELKVAELGLEKLVELAGGLEATGVPTRVQIERVEGDGRISLMELDLTAKDRKEPAALKDGDIVRVFQVVHRLSNVVYLQGNVAREGSYQLKPGMRIADLITGPEMLVPAAAWTPGAAPRPEPPAGTAGEPEARRPAAFPTPPAAAVAGGAAGAAPAGAQESGSGAASGQGAGAEALAPVKPFPEPYWEYALIRRVSRPGMSIRYLPFNLGKAVLDKDQSENLELASQDTVIVFSRWDFADQPVVRVGGAVNRPGTYPLTEGLRLRDLVSMAGGLKPYAFTEQAELLRTHYEEKGQRQERMVVSLRGALAGKAEDNMAVRQEDHLFVRSIPERRDEATVALVGEVRFPGTYPVQRGERLSSLIERAGGFTDAAYLRGAIFQRESVRALQQEHLDDLLNRLEAELNRTAATAAGTSFDKEATEAAGQQAQWQTRLLDRLRSAKARGRVVIALAPLKEFRGSAMDIQLEAGDRLAVPSRPDTVNVLGAVRNQTAVVWTKGKTYKHYLNMAGGPSEAADAGGLYVIRMDGNVVSLRQGGSALAWDPQHKQWVSGGLASMGLEPGDSILVPENLEKVAWLRDTKDVTQVLYNIAVATGVLLLVF
ncbi:MAG TPA: SLBB domain-containing protein [Planctomycetota bacterium]|nr:SLBB domain-containing protein [Planctomycetota bacterium]